MRSFTTKSNNGRVDRHLEQKISRSSPLDWLKLTDFEFSPTASSFKINVQNVVPNQTPRYQRK
jgi:hypothetical protein